MKILLATTVDNLAEKFAVLNPELEYCAIVVDNVESAKEILEQLGLSNIPLYPMSELKTCTENLNYDYLLYIQDKLYGLANLRKLISYEVPTEKVISFSKLPTNSNWDVERRLRYYREHAQDFEMFTTGTSTTMWGIDIREFKYKTINFGLYSQDLYYNFQVAKSVILYGGGHSRIHYALIGLSHYSFHFDLSKTFLFKDRILSYLIAFNDIHNFPVPIDIYEKFLRKKWLLRKPSIKNVNINGTKSEKVIVNPLKKDVGGTWEGKYYPETRDENIKILDDYLTLCEENNIRPVMFITPVTEKYASKFNKTLLDEFYLLVEQALQKHPSARFVDGYRWDGVTYDDFYDHLHMNMYGAAKFSAYLNDFIEKLEQKVQ